MSQRPSQKAAKTNSTQTARKPDKAEPRAEVVHSSPRPSPQPSPSAETAPVPAPHVAAKPQIPGEVIAERAYRLFEARGKMHGHDLEDWVRAEQQLRAEYRQMKPSL